MTPPTGKRFTFISHLCLLFSLHAHPIPLLHSIRFHRRLLFSNAAGASSKEPEGSPADDTRFESLTAALNAAAERGTSALELLPLGGETAAEAMALYAISLSPMKRHGRHYLVVVVLDMMADFSFERPARLPRGSADDDEVSTLFFNKVRERGQGPPHGVSTHIIRADDVMEHRDASDGCFRRAVIYREGIAAPHAPRCCVCCHFDKFVTARAGALQRWTTEAERGVATRARHRGINRAGACNRRNDYHCTHGMHTCSRFVEESIEKMHTCKRACLMCGVH